MRIHNLKISKKYFCDTISENKKFEVRYKDRQYQIGDLIVLEEFDEHGYTGKFANAEITYLCDDITFVKKNYIILGIKLRLDRGATL